MSRDRRRAHVVIPQDLLREVDAVVGGRKRSDFFAQAARENRATLVTANLKDFPMEDVHFLSIR